MFLFSIGECVPSGWLGVVPRAQGPGDGCLCGRMSRFLHLRYVPLRRVGGWGEEQVKERRRVRGGRLEERVKNTELITTHSSFVNLGNLFLFYFYFILF